MKSRLIQLFLISASLLATGCTISKDNVSVKLYALDCGSIAVSDMTSFSEGGKLDGQSADLANPCFLIEHSNGGRLIWETGHPLKIARIPGGLKGGGFQSTLESSPLDQLASLGLKPNDIDYVSVSHFHPDHSGNLNLFASSTFLINSREHSEMFSAKMRANDEFFENFSKLEASKTVKIEDEHDVFGDGSAVIVSMPGHTRGSSVLLVRLRNSAPVLLTGDLYTHSRARELNTVPSFNWSNEQTLRSRERFEALAKKEKARINCTC